MAYFLIDDSRENENSENEFFYNIGLEFPLNRKVKSYKNKVSYSKEKKIWFLRYKQNYTYIYLFGYNYGDDDKQLYTKDPILMLKFNLFNAPNKDNNGHIVHDPDTNEKHAVMNINFKNMNSPHKAENLNSLNTIFANSERFLDLGSIYDSKELCNNIEIVMDEIESKFFPKRHAERIGGSDEEVLETKEKIEETPKDNVINEVVRHCEHCGLPIPEDYPEKICKVCLIRVTNYLSEICDDVDINTSIPIRNLVTKAKELNIGKKDTEDIIKTLMAFNLISKSEKGFLFNYDDETCSFISKYSTLDKKDNKVMGKVVYIVDKIGFNTPFTTEYLIDHLNFKKSEILEIINFLEDKNAIIEDGEYYLLVDKSNEINGLNDVIITDDVGDSNEVSEEDEIDDVGDGTDLDDESDEDNLESTEEPTIETPIENDEPTTETPIENEESKPETKEKKPIPKTGDPAVDKFNENYEKILSLVENNKTNSEIAEILGIPVALIERWITKGKQGTMPYKLLYDGINEIKSRPKSKINPHKWKKIIEDIKNGKGLMEAASRADITYPLLQLYITNGKKGKEGYVEYYEEYQDALNYYENKDDDVKILNRCHICSKVIEDETQHICDECIEKKNFATDLKLFMEKLKNPSQFTKENLIIYYTDSEIQFIINKLREYDLIIENTTLHIYYIIKDRIKDFLENYFDAKDPRYAYPNHPIIDNETYDKNAFERKAPKIILTKSQNVRYKFKRLNEDHTFFAGSKPTTYTLEDVIFIHKSYYTMELTLEELSDKYDLSLTTIKRLIARFDAGDFDKYLEMIEKTESEENKIKCKNCGKEFTNENNSKYCNDCIIYHYQNANEKYTIICRNNPDILLGEVSSGEIAEEICVAAKNDLNNEIVLDEVINSIKEAIIEARKEEINAVEEESSKEATSESRNEQDDSNQNASKITLTEVKNINKSVKEISSMNKKLIDNKHIQLIFIGKISNHEIKPELMDVLNDLKAFKKELSFVPLDENESKIFFKLITKNNQTTGNMEKLQKYGWNFNIKDY